MVSSVVVISKNNSGSGRSGGRFTVETKIATVWPLKSCQNFRWLALSALLTLGLCAHLQAQTKPLVLVSRPDSTRAIALDSVTFTKEPFPLDSLISWTADRRTRVLVFALNLQLQPGEEPSNLTADGEDATNRHYQLRVESVASVLDQQWLTAVSLRLSDDIGDVGDLLVRIGINSRSSNRVRIAIGHAGGGLPDDPGSNPTPAPPYPIRGRVTAAGVGIPNLLVTFTGPASGTALTDAGGNYLLLAPEPGDYVVSAVSPWYEFDQPARTVANLSNRRDNVDFRALPRVLLRGRVVDGSGRGVAGIHVHWTGPQIAETSTGFDGMSFFLVTVFGNYSLTLSKEQDYYSYSPGTASVSTSENRLVEFTATLNASLSPSFVLEFDGSPKAVDYSTPHFPPDWNLFWPDGFNFGHFFWEFWAMPGDRAAATYMISDGYGAAHAILFGVGSLTHRDPPRYQLIGNIWNGSDLVSFASDDGPSPNEWGHYAVGWDGQYIVVYFNGVPVGKKAFTGPRITPGGIQGCGRLLIGGSDHSNFQGRIAQIRGYETYNPREDAGTVYASAAPETVFSVDGSLLSYFFRPSENIADLSLRGQYGRQHVGLLRGTLGGVPQSCDGCPQPQFVIDPTAPDFAHPEVPGEPTAQVENPAAVPSGALVFDSFSRRNATYVLGETGGLSATEGGTMGPQNWLSTVTPGTPQPFGILNGKAVILANSAAMTWVSIPSTSSGYDIRVDRNPGVWGSGQNTGISFRVADAGNYFFAYSSEGAETSQPEKLTVGCYSDGVRIDLASGIVMPAGWTTITAETTTTGSLSIYADGTLLYTTQNTFLASSTGAGLYNNSPGLGLTNRWDNFTVTPIP